MVRKPVQQPQTDGDDDDADSWLVTYADAVTLLMAFFIMLVSFSRIDIATFEEVAAGIKDHVGKHDLTEEDRPIENLKIEMQEVVYAMQADKVVRVETDKEGVSIELDSSAFFTPGTAQLVEAAYPVLQNMAAQVMAPKYEAYFIEVQGHTDDDPINTPLFPSNWELSAARASAVVRYFISQGSDPYKMKAIGYADTRPLYPNRTTNGTPIPENQAANRRVVLRVRPMTIEENDAYFNRKAMEAMDAGAFSEGPPPEQGGPDTGSQENPPANQ